MSLYKKFKTDAAVEADGVWLDYGDGVEIRIARAGGANKRFLKASEKFRKRYGRQIQLEILDDEVIRVQAIKIYADAIILDWKGVTDENGDELACTVENRVKVLTDLPDLFVDIQQMALSAALFKEEIDGKAAGN